MSTATVNRFFDDLPLTLGLASSQLASSLFSDRDPLFVRTPNGLSQQIPLLLDSPIPSFPFLHLPLHHIRSILETKMTCCGRVNRSTGVLISAITVLLIALLYGLYEILGLIYRQSAFISDFDRSVLTHSDRH